MKKEVYFDNAATTPICEAALARYCEVSRAAFGNPSSLHARGKEAEDILRAARTSLLSALSCKDGEVVFCASGTEANNLAIFGRAYAKARYRGGKILYSAGEHASVSAPIAALREEGFRTEEIPTRGGTLDLAALQSALTPDTLLVSLMALNNETGACYDLLAASRLIKATCRDCALHVDATQAFLHIPLSPRAIGADMLTVSSHKIEGPKGVGALYYTAAIKKEKGIAPQILGGGQEGGMRSGTENVPGIAAFAAACDVGKENFAKNTEKMQALRRYLVSTLEGDARFAEVRALTAPCPAPHILTLLLPSIKSEVMLHYLSGEGISVSSGSACSSHGHLAPSPLTAFGFSESEADCAIRISLSHRNTEEEADLFLTALAAGLSRLSRKK